MKKLSKSLSFLMALLMIVSCFGGLSVFAEEGPEDELVLADSLDLDALGEEEEEIEEIPEEEPLDIEETEQAEEAVEEADLDEEALEITEEETELDAINIPLPEEILEQLKTPVVKPEIKAAGVSVTYAEQKQWVTVDVEYTDANTWNVTAELQWTDDKGVALDDDTVQGYGLDAEAIYGGDFKVSTNNFGNRTQAGDYYFVVSRFVVVRNYPYLMKITSDPIKVTVNPLEIGVKFGDTTFTYNGDHQAPAVEPVGVLDGDTVELTVEYADAKGAAESTIKAGTYTEKVVKADNKNYKLTGVLEQQYVINPMPLSITWDTNSFVYNGKAQQPVPSISEATPIVAGDDVSVAFSWMIDKGNSNAAVADQNAINVSKYYIAAALTGDDKANYTIQKDGQDFWINKASISVALTDYDFNKTGSEINAAEAKNMTVTANGVTVPASEYEVTGDFAKSEVGNYTFKVTAKAESKNFTGEAEVAWQIAKELPKYQKPTGNTLTYANTALELVHYGYAWEGGVMMYALGQDAVNAPKTGWEYKVPTAKNAGTYYVWYYVKGDADHADTTPVCITVEIERRALTVTWETEEAYIYNGEAQSPVPGISFSHRGTAGKALYDFFFKPDDVAVSVEEAYTDAGEYTAVAKLTGADAKNYTVTVGATCDFTIAPKTVELTWDDTELVYNGEEQVPGAETTDILVDDEVGLIVSGEQINAGKDYEAKIELTGEGKENYVIKAGDETYKFSILKAELVVTKPELASDLVYSGEAQALIAKAGKVVGVDGKEGAGDIWFAVSAEAPEADTAWSTEAPTAANAGEYTVWMRVIPKDADNYNVYAEGEDESETEEVKLGTVTVAKKAVTVSATAKDKTADGTDKAELDKLNVAGAVKGETITVNTKNLVLTFAKKEAGKDIAVTLDASKVTAADITVTKTEAPKAEEPAMNEIEALDGNAPENAEAIYGQEAPEVKGKAAAKTVVELDNYTVEFIQSAGTAEIKAAPAAAPATKIPKTGDDSMALLWAGLALSMGIGAVVIVTKKKEY